MSLVFRTLQWPPEGRPSAKPDYHVVMNGDKAVGRIYPHEYPGGAKWFWSINGLAIRGEHVPSGVADTLEGAQAKFRLAWDVAEKR
jgi:hypothetical protein